MFFVFHADAIYIVLNTAFPPKLFFEIFCVPVSARWVPVSARCVPVSARWVMREMHAGCVGVHVRCPLSYPLLTDIADISTSFGKLLSSKFRGNPFRCSHVVSCGQTDITGTYVANAPIHAGRLTKVVISRRFPVEAFEGNKQVVLAWTQNNGCGFTQTTIHLTRQVSAFATPPCTHKMSAAYLELCAVGYLWRKQNVSLNTEEQQWPPLATTRNLRFLKQVV
jgi:hypothetical protein